MNYFLDTEFLEGTQKTFFGKSKPTIDLISIGIASEDNREYYAISKDFNLKEAWNRYDLKEVGDARNMYGDKQTKKVYWIRENVLKPIYYELMFGDSPKRTDKYFTYSIMKRLIKEDGKTNKQIAEEVKVFCTGDEGQHKPCKFYAYYADYDWVAFCWLFGKMVNLPQGFPMYCRDLKQILDEKEIARQDGTDMVDLRNLPTYPKQENEHNSLDDAQWNLKLFQFLQLDKRALNKQKIEDKIVYWAKNLGHKNLSVNELIENVKWLLVKIN